MSEESRTPWEEGPDEEAPWESWLGLDDDELLHNIETLDSASDEDERLLEIVTSRRHFFIRQEAAKRIRDRRRLYPFEDDRHVGQILVRHLSRREDLTYLERISMLSRHVEVRQAAQVQLARVWRRLEAPGHDTRPVPRFSAEPASTPSPGQGVAAPAEPAEGEAPSAAEASATSAPLEGDEVDGSLLGWAAHFLIEQVWCHLGTAATKEILLRSRAELSPRHATLGLFSVGEDARVKLELAGGPRIPGAAVRDLAAWMADFRRAARRIAPEAASVSVRACTNLMSDALRAVGFYTACDEAEADLAG
jgi:hypothetical protein